MSVTTRTKHQEGTMAHTYRTVFLADGNIPADNNRAGNAIQPFVVGRRNWLLANSFKGAQTSAITHALAVTAMAN